jgi:hypothetical protein
VQHQPQKKIARAARIEGAIVLYRAAARTQSIAERSLSPADSWWNVVFAVPLFLRTLIRLVYACAHWHKGPPITVRESIPSHLPGCRSGCCRGTYITCLDCGQKFAYNHKTRRMIDFWGIHDAEALAAVRRKIAGFFSPLPNLAAWVGRLNMRIPISKLAGSLQRPGILTRGHNPESQRSIGVWPGKHNRAS